MRYTFKLISAVLCALSLGVAHSQTALSKPAKVSQIPGAVSFHYDAQHDEVIPAGIQLKPSPAGAEGLFTGTLVVTLNITAVSHFHHGTSYHCSLTAIGGEIDATSGVVSGGIETASGVAKWNGTNTLSCTLTIPFEWTLIPDSTAIQGAILAFGVSAVSPEGGAVQRSTLQVAGIEPLPPSGTTSTFAFDATL